MKAKAFYKNNEHNNMDPKQKENIQEEELNVQDEAQDENGEETTEKAAEEAPLTEEEKLAQELEKANAEIEDQKDKYLRLSAEFDNYRKRTMKEKAELILNGGEKSISSILPIVDDFERALKNMETATDVAAVKEGVELIYNKFMSVLAQNGVKVIETKEQPLDTDYHEAIAVIPTPDEVLKGKILDCVQTGYTLNDKVIRHAKVVVGE
ncbi:MAG: nucleotide exchange factor GrpE [Bacteroides sp.]|nr:nucleotide exchange factor GrpE [Bacteroides sp.]